MAAATRRSFAKRHAERGEARILSDGPTGMRRVFGHAPSPGMLGGFLTLLSKGACGRTNRPSQQQGLLLLKALLDAGLTTRDAILQETYGPLLGAVGWRGDAENEEMPQPWSRCQTGLPMWIVDLLVAVYRRACEYADEIAS